MAVSVVGSGLAELHWIAMIQRRIMSSCYVATSMNMCPASSPERFIWLRCLGTQGDSGWLRLKALGKVRSVTESVQVIMETRQCHHHMLHILHIHILIYIYIYIYYIDIDTYIIHLLYIYNTCIHICIYIYICYIYNTYIHIFITTWIHI